MLPFPEPKPREEKPLPDCLDVYCGLPAYALSDLTSISVVIVVLDFEVYNAPSC
jgi:hypothetical protein